MQSPVQVVMLLRPQTRADLLAASAFSSLVFTATPFLLPAVADQYDVSLGAASLISSFQLGGFVLVSWTVGRLVDPSRRLLVGSLLAAAAFNILSGLVPWFSLLLILRAFGGGALAVVAWLGWQEVFGDEDRMGDVAVVGPVMGIAGAPIASAVAEASGADAVFMLLALCAVLPLLLPHPRTPMSAHAPRKATRSKPIPEAKVILVCLGLVTMSGSAVFVFAAALGVDRAGLDPFVVSLAFSANAVVGIPAARYRGRRPLSGLWLLATGLMALALTNVTAGSVYWLAVAAWGFAFWAGIPGVFKLLAERSAHPGDRAGDAQSVMAAGRVVGPLVGAAFLEAGSVELLGVMVALVMGSAAATLLYLEVKVPARELVPTQ